MLRLSSLALCLALAGCDDFYICAEPVEMSTAGYDNQLGCWLVTAPGGSHVARDDESCGDDAPSVTVSAGESVWLYGGELRETYGSPGLRDVECP